MASIQEPGARRTLRRTPSGGLMGRFRQPETGGETSYPVVQTPYGAVQGVARGGVATFRGLPFAQPPLGPLRFLPPRPPQPWPDVLDCTRFRDSAIQASEIDPLITRGEDCLYLNIWAPARPPAKPLPVLVFIHGGGFSEGSPAKLIFDGSRFARDGVVQVNISYRLGALGFMAFPEVAEEYGMLGNAGTLDQIAALRFVRECIHAFGGDAQRITLCGESAGAFSVSNLILSPLAKGLFQRAILESGNLLGQAIVAPESPGNAEDALVQSKAYMSFLGANGLADMQKLDAKRIAQGSPFRDDRTVPAGYCFWPVLDGYVLPRNPMAALEAGEVNPVDILAGYNTDEGTLFVPKDTDEEAYVLMLRRIFGKRALHALQRHPVDEAHSPTARARRLVEMGLRLGNDLFCKHWARQGRRAWFYNFDYALPVLERLGLGAMHALELIYVFDTAPRMLLRSRKSQRFKEELHQRWLNFIRHGDPNQGEGAGIHWPVYTEAGRETLVLNLDCRVAEAPHADDAAFYADLLWKSDRL